MQGCLEDINSLCSLLSSLHECEVLAIKVMLNPRPTSQGAN